MKQALPGWPAMLRQRAAADYCSLTVTEFEQEIAAGRLPTPVILGKHEHWNKAQLDKALDAISGGVGQSWREKCGLPERRVA